MRILVAADGAASGGRSLRQEETEKEAKKLLDEEEERRKTRRRKKVSALFHQAQESGKLCFTASHCLTGNFQKAESMCGIADRVASASWRRFEQSWQRRSWCCLGRSRSFWKGTRLCRFCERRQANRLHSSHKPCLRGVTACQGPACIHLWHAFPKTYPILHPPMSQALPMAYSAW